MRSKSSSSAAAFDALMESILRLNAFGSLHEAGVHFADVDGSVSFVTENIDQRVLGSMTTRAGSEADY